jgi:hypothetical protein
VEPDEIADLVFPEPSPEEVASDGALHAEARPIDRFRRTAAGSVVAAGLFGLRDALEGRPEREEVTIVSEAPSRPVDGFTLVFDPDDPSSLKVVIPPPPHVPPEAPVD